MQEKNFFVNNKYSIQREQVINALKATKAHPTAEELQFMLKQAKFNVSLATVYRTLKELVNQKRVLTLETIDKKLHYDADLSDHSHFICKDCGKIIDVFEPVYTPKTLVELGVETEEKKCIYYGKCAECKTLAN